MRSGVPLGRFPPIELPALEAVRSSKDDFMRDLVLACNPVRKYLIVVAGLVPSEPLSKLQQGVLVGHMVRLYKLYDTVMLLVAKNRGEIALLVTRPLTETIINIRFLIRYATEEVLRAFQKASLAYEKRLWDEIQSRKSDPLLPIEERMLGSIQRTFERAGIAMNEVSWGDRHWAGDTSQRAQKVDLVDLYEFGFRTGSHNIHGTWHELDFHHLKGHDTYYEPEPRYTSPGPQLIEMPTVLGLDVSAEYVHHVVGASGEELIKRLIIMRDWFSSMIELHENFLLAQQATETDLDL